MKLKKNTKNVGLVIGLYIVLTCFLLLTDPRKLAIGWLILPFVLLFVALYMSILLIVRSSILADRIRRPLTLTVLIAGVPTLILLLDSVNQLSLKDVLIIVVFGVFALFYFNKLSVK